MKHTPTLPLSDRQRAYYGVRSAKKPGSVDWCWQTILLMQRRWQQKTMDEAGFNALVDELSAHEAWKVVPPEQPYGSLDELLKAEIGHDAQTMRQALQQRNQAADRQAKQVGPQGKHLPHHDTNENVVMVSAQGNSASYALRRLSRSPDPAHQALYQQCLAGAITPNAAMIQAGLRTRPPSRKRTPLDILRQAWLKASPAERATFLAEVPAIGHSSAASKTARAITQRWGESYARLLMYELQYVLDPVVGDNDFDDEGDEDDEAADAPALTLHQAYAYFLARCQEGGLTQEQAEDAWIAYASPALEDELMEAESYGPHIMQMIDAQILSHLGLPPHDAEVPVQDPEDAGA